MVQRQLFKAQGPWFSKVRRCCVGASGTVDSVGAPAGASSSPPTAPILELLTSSSLALPSSSPTSPLHSSPQHGRPYTQAPRPAGELRKIRKADTSPTVLPSRTRSARSQSCSRPRATASLPTWVRNGHLLAAPVPAPVPATPFPPSSLGPLHRTQHSRPSHPLPTLTPFAGRERRHLDAPISVGPAAPVQDLRAARGAPHLDVQREASRRSSRLM